MPCDGSQRCELRSEVTLQQPGAARFKKNFAVWRGLTLAVWPCSSQSEILRPCTIRIGDFMQLFSQSHMMNLFTQTTHICKRVCLEWMDFTALSLRISLVWCFLWVHVVVLLALLKFHARKIFMLQVSVVLSQPSVFCKIKIWTNFMASLRGGKLCLWKIAWIGRKIWFVKKN